MNIDQTAKRYLLDCIDSDDVDLVTTQDKIEHVKERFESEYGHEVVRYGQHKALVNWLQGLALNIVFNNCDILDLAKSWDSLPQDATEKQEDKILDNYWNLMAVKLGQLFRGYRVPK